MRQLLMLVFFASTAHLIGMEGSNCKDYLNQEIKLYEDQIKKLEQSVKKNPLDPAIDKLIMEINHSDDYLRRHCDEFGQLEDRFQQVVKLLSEIQKAKEDKFKEGKCMIDRN